MTLHDVTPPALDEVRRSSAPIAPRSPPGIVPRLPLVRWLTAAQAPIAMLVAPAGYGKTTLLAEWAARDEREFTWLSAKALAADGDGAVASFARLVEDLRSAGRPHVVVLDDAHRLATHVSMRRLADVAVGLPEGSCLALASRRQLAVPVARLRAHRLLVELGPRELAMGRLEAAMLLDGTGVRLEAEQVDRLVAATEGWPAGLYLAALAIQEQDGDADAVERLTGADRLIAGYLRSEVLAEVSPDEATFLRRTSILETLTAPLCDAVLRSRGSAAMLERLVRGPAPLEPVDRGDTAVRCNRLMAEMLRADLERLEPALVPALHRRAADWHARHGDQRDAVAHAVASGDGARTGRLLWALAPRAAARGRAGEVGRWLERLPSAQLREQPELALTAAAWHLAGARRDEAEHWGEAAERALGAGDVEGEPAAAAAMVRACVAREGMDAMARDAARARTLTTRGGAWLGLADLLEGVARHLSGEPAEAEPLLEEGVRRASGEAPIVAAACHAQLALLAVDGGDGDGAVSRAEAARTALTAVPTTPVGHALVLAVAAAVAADRGDVVAARRDSDLALRLLTALAEFTPWYVAEAQIALARAEIRLSRAETARGLLTAAARNAAHVPDAPVLGRWLHEAWERADAFAAGATGTGPVLTIAELRVLRFLPSHLSFREIGGRLHLSTNTVKTQALAVYRKLDVSCRSDAVARGRSVGLIDG
jgi:LuxR family maltose regulon positive regulatory protein